MHRYLTLIRTLTWTDFKLRFVKTRIGLVWAIAKPFLVFTVLYAVLSLFTDLNGPDYMPQLLLGVILWNAFADATVASLNNLLGKRELVRKIAFPTWTVVLSACLQSFAILAINLVIFSAFTPSAFVWTSVLALPAAAFFCTFTFGLALALAALNVLWRDVAHVWEVALQLGFWVSPVVYPVSVVPPAYRSWYRLNPIASTIDAMRNLLIFQTVGWRSLLFLLLVCVSTLAFGLAVFQRLRPRVVEEI